ncbi:MAG: cellulase family glycosylhydrolase [Spirochaetales bacterium]|nr:cellulase family glycosylhydrolase [Spirochaetales bacterium]
MNNVTFSLIKGKFVCFFIILMFLSGNVLFGEEIHYMCGETNTGSDCIFPLIKINNNTSAQIQWSSLEIRYYITKDDSYTSYRFACESTPVSLGIQPTQVKSEVVNRSGDEYYLKITFTASSFIPANYLTGAFRFRLYVDNARVKNQANDYSFNAGYSSYAAWTKITLYKNSTLVWGIEPGGENPTTVPTEVSTPEPSTDPTETPVLTSTPTTVPTATPITSTSVPTPDVTDPPVQNDCTCDSGCSARTDISLDFAQNGSGEYCWTVSCIGEYVNSWNLAVLEINGVDVTNTWVSATQLPARMDGVYYIYYKANYSWSHFEARGVCNEPVSDPDETDPPPTSTPEQTGVLTSPPTPTPNGSDTIWIEAESGAVYSPQILKSDSFADNSPNDCASQEIYFEVNNGSNSTGSAPQDGHMAYTFTISQSGEYRVWTRVKTPNTGDDSFWVKMDSGAWTKWDNIGPFPEWEWDSAGDYTLSSGTHTLTFAYCEDGAKFDKLLITGDFLYTPSGLGNPEPGLTGGNTYRRNDMVDVHGNLQVIGTNLCNKNGNPVQLKGLNTHGPQWYPIVENHTIPNLVQSPGIDIVRIAMYIEDFKNGDFWNGYLAHKEEIKQKVVGYVDDAIDAGIYVIIDWHIHNNPANFTSDAKDFFAEMAQRFGGYPNVLFDICNEPEYTEWPIVKSYAEEVIPVIRSNDPDDYDNIIIVGTPNWCQDVNTAADNPLTGFNNIMYALHFYAASHKQSYRDKAQYALDKNIPVIATEWSSCDYDVSYSDFTEADTWVNWLNSNNISWINWSFCNRDDKSAILKPGVSMAGPWASSDFTDAGTWVIQKIQQ